MIFIKIIGETKGYLIHEDDAGHYTLCKILKEYGNEPDSKDECTKDLVDLLCHNTTEKKLLKEKKIMHWKDE